MAPLAGKVALVTGSSPGIGRAIAERLGRDGAPVVNYVQSAEKACDAVAAIEAGKRCTSSGSPRTPCPVGARQKGRSGWVGHSSVMQPTVGLSA